MATAPSSALANGSENNGTPTWVVVIGIILGVLATLLFIGYLAGSTPEAQERETDRRAIEMCRDELKEQPLGSGARSLVRGTCEMMENKFEQKYGRRP